jgi:hypothetical protein
MAAARGPAMKSISIMWAEGVTDAEAATVVNAVKQVVQVMYDLCYRAGVGLSPTAIKPFGTWVMPSVRPGDPYSGTQWYVETAYDQALGQVLAPRFLELVKQEPWQIASPHFDVAVLDRDLTEGSGSVMGSVLPGTATVISVHRLRDIPGQDERLRALRRYRRELAELLRDWDERGAAEGEFCGLIEHSNLHAPAEDGTRPKVARRGRRT